MRIQFYEKVIVANSVRFPEYVGRTGVVLGISEDSNKVYSYSVFIEGEDGGVSFMPGDLIGTGELVDRSQFYDERDRVKVQVNGDEGSLSD